MKLEVSKQTLINLLRSSNVYVDCYSIESEPVVKNLGEVTCTRRGDEVRWNWNDNKLNKLSNEQLIDIYNKLNLSGDNVCIIQ